MMYDTIDTAAIMTLFAAVCVGLTLVFTTAIRADGEKAAIEQGYIILQGDKFRIERVE